MHKLLLTLLLLSSSFFVLTPVYSAPGEMQRVVSPFDVDARLERRVQFWIDIFTRYGKDHSVIHHRLYPQVIFKVLDFTAQARTLSPIQLEKYKTSMVKREINELQALMKYLSNGGEPRDSYEQEIVRRMEFIPGETAKYKRVVKDDLIRSQTGIREKFEAAIKRSGRYLPMMERVFIDHGLPTELTRLPFIESSFDYTAYSSVGAAGLWQFMSRTAKLYDMTVTSAVDERRDPVKATHGAARYLMESYERLGDWPLAITSYNHGPYGVSRAIKKAGSTDICDLVEDDGDRVFGFASSNFYPEFLAALNVFKNYKHYFPGLVRDPPIEFDQIVLPQSLSASTISHQLGVSPETLQEYNYALTKNVWNGRYSVPAGFALKVPVGTGVLSRRLAKQEVAESAKSASSIYGGASYKVRPGDTLSSIAKKFKTSVDEIRRNNNLSSDRLRVGQLLVVKERESGSAIVQLSPATPKKESAPSVVPSEASGVVYTVKKGDSLWSIAKNFNVDVNQLRKKNRISNSSIRAGQKLIIP